jgi:hypothetical protein
MADQSPQPYPGLKQLEPLVGTWQVKGPDIHGQVRFEWLAGGFFLLQHVDFVHSGRHITGLEVIGYPREFGATEPGPDLVSRWYGSDGETFTYVYENDAQTLTIWGGEKGSPAYYRGTWSADGNVNSGGWVYPGGGGYEATMTRVK